MPTKTLGPWDKGLNLTSNRDLSVFLSDDELGDAENIIFTPEGFVQPRPGVKSFLANGTVDMYQHPGTGNGNTIPEWSVVGTVDTGAGGVYAIVQVTSDFGPNLYKVRDEDINAADANIQLILAAGVVGFGAWFTHLIVNTGFASDVTDPTFTPSYTYKKDIGVLLFTNLDNRVYIAPLDLDTVAKPIVMYDAAYKVPASHYGMIVKNRLFLFDYDKNIMWWSPVEYILDFRVGVLAPYGNDSSGQEIIEGVPKGQPAAGLDKIRSVEFYNNNFYIFKRAKTFMFTYQVSPLTDGYLRKISDSMGAYDSTLYRGTIIVINNRGVFRVENTEFFDMQSKMNFRFEIPIDHPQVSTRDVFITNYNDNVLFGFRDMVTNPNTPKMHYYNMNALNGAWSKWTFDYTDDLAMPASDYALCQKPNTTMQKAIFSTYDRKKFVFVNWKPHPSLYDYHLDSKVGNGKVRSTLYFPNVSFKTTAAIGDSLLDYKKLYRYYLRMYLSEPPAVLIDPAVWTLSINYNHYTFDSLMNPLFGLYPAIQPYPDPHASTITTTTYQRTYQIRLPQQRAKEFVFEIKRRFSSIASDVILSNPDADRPIKTGYYFLISGLWFDYQDKARL